MTATMTSRQRLECAMRGGEPDRMACGPYGLGHISLDTPIGQELLASTDLMVDVSIGGDPILGVSAEVLTTQEGDTVTFAIPTPKGPLVRRVRQTAVTSATVEFPFKTPEDVEKLLSLPYTAPEPDVSAYRAMEERVGEEGLVMGGVCTAVCLAASWFSPEGFCLAWADAPEQVMRLTALAAERINAWVEKACRAGVRAFRLIGGEYVTVQLGPRAVPDLLTRFDTALVDVIHRHGALAHYHNHGPLCGFCRSSRRWESTRWTRWRRLRGVMCTWRRQDGRPETACAWWAIWTTWRLLRHCLPKRLLPSPASAPWLPGHARSFSAAPHPALTRSGELAISSPWRRWLAMCRRS